MSNLGRVGSELYEVSSDVVASGNVSEAALVKPRPNQRSSLLPLQFCNEIKFGAVTAARHQIHT